MNNEQLAMSNYKIIKNKNICFKYFLFSLIVLLAGFFGCDNAFQAPETEKPAEGKGYLYLVFNDTETGRTIMPPFDKNMFVYKLEFFEEGADIKNDSPVVSLERTEENISDSIILDVGTWDLYVTAFFDEELLNPAAKGNLKGIVIEVGTAIEKSVVLTGL